MPDLPRRRSAKGPLWLRRISGRMTADDQDAGPHRTLCVYLFYVFARDWRPFLEAHLALGPAFFKGELWQPLTSLFVHLDFVGFVLTTIGLWFVGHGDRAGAGAAAHVGAVLRRRTCWPTWSSRASGDSAVSGPSRSSTAVRSRVMALFVAFARMYGRQPVQFWPTTLMVQARYLVLILVGLRGAGHHRAGRLALAGGAVGRDRRGLLRGGAGRRGRRSGRSSRTRGTSRRRAGCGGGSASSTAASARRRNTSINPRP